MNEELLAKKIGYWVIYEADDSIRKMILDTINERAKAIMNSWNKWAGYDEYIKTIKENQANIISKVKVWKGVTE